ncbi:hypothetical protein AB0469_22975 [Streptomyces sp. NPDC093801]|uniref:hypothetical protein n=1 Tax=Streptomyces sp. NPDC093801 TaxID=3155203 RepID=UPI003450D08F
MPHADASGLPCPPDAPTGAPARTARPSSAGVLAAVLLSVLTASSCGTAAGEGGAGTCTVRHETDRITSRFPSFKQLESTSWCGIDPDVPSRLPSHNDIRLVGVLNAVDDQAVLRDLQDPALEFRPAVPENVPPEIAELLPEGADWMTSGPADKRITEDLYSGSFFYDRRSGQVLFDCWNPPRKDGPAPAGTGG